MGDYYGASYTLERSSCLEIDTKVLEKIKCFIEGATLIMKKKFKKGIENLNYLFRKEHITEQIRPLLFSFRSYAHFCQYKFINALNDLKGMSKAGHKLDPSSEYNLLLLEGIIQCQNNNFHESIICFNSAQKMRETFSDPLIYKGLARICEFNRNPRNKNESLLN